MKTSTCWIGAAVLLLACSGCTGGTWFGKAKSHDEDFTSADAAEVLKGTASASGAAAEAPRRAKVSAKPVASKGRSALKPAEDEDSPETAGFFKRFSQARGLETSGKLDEARDAYQKLIVDFPKRYEAYHRLGLVADKQRRFREAESLFAQALRIKPRDAELFNDLGYCHYLQGKLDKAESAAAKAVGIKPAETRYRNNLGLIYGAQGRLDEALECFRRGGSEADAQYNLAFVLATHNDLDGAKKRFRLALAADPSHEAARTALRSFEQAERDGDKTYNSEFTQDGRRWEPYKENTSAQSQKPAPGNTASSRAMQSKAHALVQSRLNSQSAP